MNDLSLTTIHLIAAIKIVLFIYLGVAVFLIWKNKKPHWHLIAISSGIFIFTLILLLPLKKMWWGNSGDELFVGAFLNRVLHGQIFFDFYYGWLAPFYPPLYFWVTGTISRLFASNAITAAKIGILGTILLWFIGSYFWQKLFWARIDQNKNKVEIQKSPWFWLLFPIIFFISLNFEDIIVKPYEAVSALFCVILIGLIAESFDWQKWDWRTYLFLGIPGGLLFLTFYFWWIILILVMLYLALISQTKVPNIKRIIILGFVIFALSSIYLIPLFLNYSHYGIENWQATYFVPGDLATFAPWQMLSLKSVILIAGLIGLIVFAKEKFIRANLLVLIAAFGYQFINFIILLAGSKPLQMQKPFLFLAGASLCAGATYLVIYLYQNYLAKTESSKVIVIVIVIVFSSMLAMINFIDKPEIQSQVEKDLITSPYKDLAGIIKQKVPNYQTRIWLSSGTPEINLYIPLNYYIAHNPHFSHPAAIYSQRLKLVKSFSQAKSPDEFNSLATQAKITGLILFKGQDNFPIFYWQDNYPNGGKESEIDIPQNLVSETYWQKAYEDKDWEIFVKK